MYDLTVDFTKAGRQTITLPTLKILKDFVKEALQPEDGGLTGLDKIVTVKQGDTIKQLVDVTKWFYESYHSSHATKLQKQWIENNIFKV